MNAAKRLRVVFFGTSEFAVPSLRKLAEAHDIVAVVTQPDRPAGRGLAMKSSPVMENARASGLRVLAPSRLDAAFISEIASLRPELLACASYGKILPAALLGIAGMTALNVHPSLLPLYRGASPIQAALRDGQTKTGVTIFHMAQEMDSGDIVIQEVVEIDPDDDYGSLHDRLAERGAYYLSAAARVLGQTGTLAGAPQDHAAATFTKPIRKEDLRISADVSAKRIVDLVRSASPQPGAWTMYGGKRLKVLKARAEPATSPQLTSDGPSIPASDGIVRLLRVIPEGKREMSGSEFARGLA